MLAAIAAARRARPSAHGVVLGVRARARQRRRDARRRRGGCSTSSRSPHLRIVLDAANLVRPGELPARRASCARRSSCSATRSCSRTPRTSATTARSSPRAAAGSTTRCYVGCCAPPASTGRWSCTGSPRTRCPPRPASSARSSRSSRTSEPDALQGRRRVRPRLREPARIRALVPSAPGFTAVAADSLLAQFARPDGDERAGVLECRRPTGRPGSGPWPELTMPTLVSGTDRDPLHPFACAEACKRLPPRCAA